MKSSAVTSQPRGFFVLFFAEMCERYGFYTSAYLLVPFAIGTLGFSEIEASLLFGTYTALIYSIAFAGGIIADRILGFRAAMLVGLALMASGSFLLATGWKFAAYLGLATLLVGNGYFKPNVSGLLGLQYSKDDARRDGGFALFYMGVNIGAGAAALGAGLLAREFGYQAAFLVAALAKLAAFVALYLGQGRLSGDDAVSPRGVLARADLAGVPNTAWLLLGTAATVLLGNQLLYHAFVAGEVLAVSFFVVLAYFLRVIVRVKAQDRNDAFVMLTLFVFGVVFWAVSNEYGDTILLFIAQAVDRTVFGAELPASAFLSLNPITIIVGAPLMAGLWLRLSSAGRSPSYGARFVIGLLLTAAAFFILSLVPAGSGGLVAPSWIVLFFLLYSFGELFVAPVGLSMVSRLATKELAGFAMGMWYTVHALGNYGSGLVAELATMPAGSSPQGEVVIGQELFQDSGLLALAAGLLLLVLLPLLNRRCMPDRTDKDA